MTGPRPKRCAACGRGIAAREVYYRFKLVLQGEQDVLDSPGEGEGDDLAALVRQLEAGPEDPRELEEQVHWERAGVVCAACRSLVVRTLTAPPGTAGPH
jgi:hypothetical protein